MARYLLVVDNTGITQTNELTDSDQQAVADGIANAFRFTAEGNYEQLDKIGEWIPIIETVGPTLVVPPPSAGIPSGRK